MKQTPRRGRPLSPAGHLDRAAEQLVEARGQIVLAIDRASLAVAALGELDPHLRVLRDVLDGRAAA